MVFSCVAIVIRNSLRVPAKTLYIAKVTVSNVLKYGLFPLKHAEKVVIHHPQLNRRGLVSEVKWVTEVKCVSQHFPACWYLNLPYMHR